MKRRLFNILSAISLVLCGALVLLWVRSLWVSDVITLGTTRSEKPGYRWGEAQSFSGLFSLMYIDTEESGPPSWPMGLRHDVKGPERTYGDTWHLKYSYEGTPFDNEYFIGGHCAGIEFPKWPFVMSTAILPMRWLWLYRRRRLRKLKGLCLHCGYDLRASKDRCPECGTPIIPTESKV